MGIRRSEMNITTGAKRLADDPRWTAVAARDRAADGQFFYSVKTTGVFCRPSCAARLPRRENVEFHATRAAAERAGFRPCKRCKPDQPPLAQRRTAAIVASCRHIESSERVPKLDELAQAAGMSPHHFHRAFKAATGVTPREYAAAARAERVRTQLQGSASVTNAIYDAGFNSGARFYDQSRALLGMTPTAYRSGGKNEAICFAVGQCSLGCILVAASERGICAILLGDDSQSLVRDLHDRFARAKVTSADAGFEAWVATVIAFVEAPALGLDLPLDVRGTAFQQRVWQALTKIPAGATASYAEVAQRIGAPHAARAVARACTTNTLAVAIPCHRVVRSDGGLSGYRWGIARKRALLERERRK
jgi:AraC family transcriptional regulator of adaptative response/methylated-DNA-[protein]-cysteine methyltransferase